MSHISKLDVLSFRSFLFAAESLNFTEASKRAGATQSGVSQHVARLEEQVGTQLFLRVGKKIILTNAGEKLKAYIEKYLDSEDLFLEEIIGENENFQGLVKYAMPASCLKTPHFSMLVEERMQSFSDVELSVRLCPSDNVINLVLDNKIDFGFTTKPSNDPRLKEVKFCKETYVLIAKEKINFNGLTPGKLKKMSFISHPGVEDLFYFWRKIFSPKSNLSWKELNVKGTANNLDAAITMVRHGMGLTVIPEHCVSEELRKKNIFKFLASSPENQIYIISLKERLLPRRVTKVINTFLDLKG